MKVIVIGGGPAGMTAAIVAARRGHEVTVLEHKDKIGRKLLATGNGRCNLSNRTVGEDPVEAYKVAYSDIYKGEDAELVKSIFNKVSYDDTMRFFSELGLMFKYRGDLVYPNSDQASGVLDALRFELRDLGVNVLTDCKVKEIKTISKGFAVDCVFSEKKDSLVADKVILATGSKAQPKLGAEGSGYLLAKRLGHKITQVTPGLVSFLCEGSCFKELAGVRTGARLSLIDREGNTEKNIYEESGELQLTNYGISGIAAMNLSNRMPQVKGQAYIKIDFMEDMSRDELSDMLREKVAKFGHRQSGELFYGVLPKKLGDVLLKLSGIRFDKKISEVSDSEWKRLLSNLKEWKVRILGTNNFDSAQICLGGVRLDEIKDTMESRIVPGFYFAGEILDLHGDCGGFNLQLAWTTGAIAGMLA